MALVLLIPSTCLESEMWAEVQGSPGAWPQDLVREGFPVGTSLGDGKPLLCLGHHLIPRP